MIHMGFVKQGAVRSMQGIALAAGLLTVLAGCGEEQFNRGYVIDQSLLSQIKPGSSAEQVVTVLGTPSTTSTVGGQTYYYISQRASRSFAFQNPQVDEQQVVAIYLNSGNRVERIANYGLQDGVIFDFISRKTPAGGEETSFLRQIFGLVGGGAPSGVESTPQQ
jgi:outer membrane protein assembly factor BamE (lipoprotein component of BamABCDE complex)